MVHLSEQQNKQTELPVLLDPVLLRAARQIYRSYGSLHTKLNKSPLGVAIDREHHRGQVIFNRQPILLPGECFITLRQLESEAY